VLRVIGAPRASLFRDFYHIFLRVSWWWALSFIVLGYLALNAAFALAYLAAGGVSGTRAGSIADAFFFSVQTMGTIGYGAMYPISMAANLIVVIESVAGLLLTAVATGLVFSKFARSTARVVFSRSAVIAPVDGVPTVMIRIGNQRGNQIVEAMVHLTLTRTERTAEGMTFYRAIDLTLTRSRAPALSRAWTVLHRITPESPLYGQTPASIREQEMELSISVAGVDDTLNQTAHARHSYTDADILWGARPADMLSEEPDGSLTIDVRRFHDLVPTEATPDFPYSLKDN